MKGNLALLNAFYFCLISFQCIFYVSVGLRKIL